MAFHKSVELAEIGTPDESITYDDYQADFAGTFHDLRETAGWSACLSPTSYIASQTLAARLLEAGALGVVYPSVRHAGGTCLACFRPALVGRVRRRHLARGKAAKGRASRRKPTRDAGGRVRPPRDAHGGGAGHDRGGDWRHPQRRQLPPVRIEVGGIEPRVVPPGSPASRDRSSRTRRCRAIAP